MRRIFVAMTRTDRSVRLGVLALAGALVLGLSCTRAESTLPLAPSDSAAAAPLPLTGASSPGPGQAGGLGAFPAFMPPVAIGSDTQECQLGTDPYSTCI